MMRELLIWVFLSACITNVAKTLQEPGLTNNNNNNNNTTNSTNNVTSEVNIGVIYHEDSPLGKMGLKCMQRALFDFYNSQGHYKTRIKLHTRLFPEHSIVDAAAAALYLLKNVQVKAIVMGATTSMEAHFVIHLGEKAHVPIISYSPMSPFLYFAKPSYYYINMAQDDLHQTRPICALVEAFGWQEVIPIYVKTDYESARLIPPLVQALNQIDVHVPYHGALPLCPTDDQIIRELHKLKAMRTQVFVVHLSPPELASRLFMRANEMGMMEASYAWILTTSITNVLVLEHSFDDTTHESMQGALGVKTYIPKTSALLDIKARRWELNAMGVWAYDAATALAEAVEQVGTLISTSFQTKLSENFTYLDDIGVSPVGPNLVQAMLNCSFKGLAANSTYQIVNVIGNSGRGVGFWTPEKGLVRDLNSSSPAYDSILRRVIWPGDTTSPPPGVKKLRVGVPVKAVYEELVNVSCDGENVQNEAAVATGFCIDVFNAAMEKVGYAGRYQFFPFAKPDCSPNGSYDDLVQQVALQKYDIVVGDISIIGSRRNVDFTLPYTESGVTLVVPVKPDKDNAWVFLKPLTMQLWGAILCAFVFIALVIWILEHRVNEEFRGPPSHQAGTSLFFSFSMSVFAQRENVVNNLTRFVVIIWVFVVLVLTQSYTASLTSMLTVQKLQPTVTDIDQLLKNGDSVGFQEGSFVKGLLQRKGFPETKLVSYNTSENLDNLLSKGSAKGGIAAVCDEVPYMRLFLAKYSSKYTMVQLSYKTDGFGFAFPEGSSLAPKVSKAILDVTEGDEMLPFERKWGLQLNSDMPDQGKNLVTSEQLGLDSFWGLFLTAGVASVFALFIFAATFLYEHRHIWMNNDASTWTKLQILAKTFKQRDDNFYTFRKSDLQSRRTINDQPANIDGDDEVGVTQDDTGSPDQIQENLSFSPEPSELASMSDSQNAPPSPS